MLNDTLKIADDGRIMQIHVCPTVSSNEFINGVSVEIVLFPDSILSTVFFRQ
jgi:hypothetical protein